MDLDPAHSTAQAHRNACYAIEFFKQTRDKKQEQGRPAPSMPSSSSLASTSTATSIATVRGRHHSSHAGDAFRMTLAPRRRLSLPTFSKAFHDDPVPARTGTASSSPTRQPKRARERTLSPLRASMVAKNGSARKLFTLDGDTEGSDAEEDPERDQDRERAAARERIRQEEIQAIAAAAEAQRQADAELQHEEEEERARDEANRMAMVSEAEMERLRTGTRRYHALMELLATEVGYLMDLRALVTVYLEQLSTLTASHPPPSTSALSLPALARSLPSSRSSFLLHPLSAPSPSASASLHLETGSDTGHGPPKDEPDREQVKGAKREKSRERSRVRGTSKVREVMKEKEKSRATDKKKGKEKELEPEGHADMLKEGDHREKENLTLTGQNHDPHHLRKSSRDEQGNPLPTSQSSNKGKHVRRPLLAEKDVRAVSRNADELLRFHDRFVRELRETVGDYGLSRAFVTDLSDEGKSSPNVDDAEPVGLDRIDEAVSIVAEKFISQAASFSIYEAFCPGHNEATNLIRNVQETYPSEWDAYEQRCSALISYALDFGEGTSEAHGDDHLPGDNVAHPLSAATVMPPSPPVAEPGRKKRRHSTSSLAMLSSNAHADFMPQVAMTKSDPTERKREHSSSSSGHGHRTAQAPRLKFLDYLIKPVQRICRYPLLIDQLRTKRQRTLSTGNLPSRTDSTTPNAEMGLDVAERASEAMRVVVSLVDRASEMQAQIIRSALIASRMIFTHPPVSPASNHGHSAAGSSNHRTSALGRPQGLTPEFVASLGPCHLTGALDVVHHPSPLYAASNGALRAKYLGAFLYKGGYLIMVKIPKSGKVYDPRFWFPLSGYELFDSEDDESSLPFSFHLVGSGHHLQFAAACQSEKVMWMTALQESLTFPANWTNEPASSLQVDDKAHGSFAAEDGPAEWSTTPLPTIQSLSELEGQEEQSADGHVRPRALIENRPRPSSRLDSMAVKQEHMQVSSFAALSRRSSTASVKAFFSPMSLDTITRIARPSPQVRQHVDHGLHDVFSEKCLAARSQSLLREEDLYQARRRPGTNVSRSNSGLSITGAMGLAARRRYDSVLVSRRKGSLDGGTEHPTDLEVGGKNLTTLSGKAKSMASKRRKRPLPSVVPAVASNLAKVESEAELDAPKTQSPTGVDSPFPASHCSSTASSNAGSALPSPVDLIVPLPTYAVHDGTLRQSDMLGVEESKGKRARSMADNVRYFFTSRPASPSSSSGHHSPTPPPTVPLEPEVDPQTSFVQWLRKGSLRRRVQSSPEMPQDEGQPASPGRASEENRGSFLVQVSSNKATISLRTDFAFTRFVPLPAYPSSRVRASLSPSQLVSLHQTVTSALAQALALPPAQCDSSTTRTFVSSYAKDAAHTALQHLIWNDEQKPSKVFADLSQIERTIRQRAFYLAERLAASASLDLQTLFDLCVAYAPTNATRLRNLLSSAFSHNASTLFKAVQGEAVPAFTAMLSTPSQGLYGLRKTAHILLCFLRPAPADLVRPFARDKSFTLALARAYDHGLANFAQSYGGLRLPSNGDIQASRLDEWERLFLETKVALLDSFHILIGTLLADVAAVPVAGPELAAQCESAFEIVFALLELPPSAPASSANAAPLPFLNCPLLADYQHAYDLSKTLADTLKRADDARAELLEATLRGLDGSDGEGPGALKLLLRSSGIAPGIDYQGRGPSRATTGGDAKGKGKGKDKDKAAPLEEDPALDAAVAQVLDILPDQPPEYLRFLLGHSDYPYKGDAERLIGALLEGTAPNPDEVEAAMRRAEVVAGVEPSAVREAVVYDEDEFTYTRDRRNAFDDEAMDIRNVRIGKKTDDVLAVLQDREFMEQMKADILRRAEAISDDEDEDRPHNASRYVAFEEELDEDGGGAVKVRDGDESELDGPDMDEDVEETEDARMKPETILELAYLQDPKQFERDGQTRRSKARADLKAQTGWTDEQIEGWKIMLERNPNKDKVLAKHEFSGNKPLQPGPSSGPSHLTNRGRGRGHGRGGRGRGSGRGGSSGGGGGEGSNASDRAWKDKNKASRANHNRKRGHDKKMARAGGPS
ncbi:hypothetical protein IEO21_05499 [Rhodonia placenta]|uniref:DH domain-containing protein n=1 Tax=Rhodonia placenta TaxID=104341 RepID=A0A8H7P298_9APHY|nr:hypothetical protein IEO21_05499 [Postia placenta]